MVETADNFNELYESIVSLLTDNNKLNYLPKMTHLIETATTDNMPERLAECNEIKKEYHCYIASLKIDVNSLMEIIQKIRYNDLDGIDFHTRVKGLLAILHAFESKIKQFNDVLILTYESQNEILKQLHNINTDIYDFFVDQTKRILCEMSKTINELDGLKNTIADAAKQ